MVTLVQRKSADNFLKYFGGDWDSPMWDAVDGPIGQRLAPRLGKVEQANFDGSKWRPLESRAFSLSIKQLSEVVVAGGVLAYELAFSAPKTVSIAALAGPRVETDILAAHLAAVDDVLEWLSPYLFTRSMKEGKTLVGGAEATMFEFTHPWNRMIEPQLHTHVTIARAVDENALWAYSLYLLQRPMRAVYHYSMAQRLRVLGVRIRVGEPFSLTWELQGIADGVLEGFLQRKRVIHEQVLRTGQGMFSQGAETRYAALASRRQLPKTDPEMSLATAREQWAKLAAREQCVPIAARPSPPGGFRDPVDLEIIFRTSSVISPAQFQAAHLAAWLGSSVPLAQELEHIQHLQNGYQREGLLVREGRGICFPAVFQQEEEILRQLASGYRRGTKLRWRGVDLKSSLGKALEPLATLSDRIRIGCTFGESLPVGVGLQDENGRDMPNAIVPVEKWDVGTIRNLIEARGADENCVLLVKEGFHKGDFLQRLHRLLPGYRVEDHLQPRKPFSLFGKKVTVEPGDFELKTVSVPGRRTEKRGLVSRLRRLLGFNSGRRVIPERDFVIFAPDHTDGQLREINQHLLEAGSTDKGQLDDLCEVVEWDEFLRNHQWKDTGIFCRASVTGFRGESDVDPASGGFRHGDTWWFTGPPEAQYLPTQGKRKSRLIHLGLIREILKSPQRSNILLVRKKPGLAVPGMAYRSLIKFSKLQEHEVVVLKNFARDGSWVFDNNSVWRNSTRLLEPVAAVGSFPPKQRKLPIIVALLPPDSRLLERIKTLPREKLLIVSNNAEEVCRRIQFDLNLRHQIKQHEGAKKLLFSDDTGDEEGFFLPRKRWKELIELRLQPVSEGTYLGELADVEVEVISENPVAQAKAGGSQGDREVPLAPPLPGKKKASEPEEDSPKPPSAIQSDPSPHELMLRQQAMKKEGRGKSALATSDEEKEDPQK